MDALRQAHDYERARRFSQFGDPIWPGVQVELRSPARFDTDVYANAFPSRDLDVTLRFTFTPDRNEKQYRSSVTVGISDLRWKEQWQSDHDYQRMIGSVEISTQHTIFQFGNRLGTDVPLPDPGIGTGGKHPHEVRAVRVGGQIEVFHNNRRVLWLPVDDRAEASGLFFKLVNVRTKVLDIKAEELLELR